MLPACAHSPDNRPEAKPDPVIERTTEIVTVCPPEIMAEVPPSEPPLPGMVLEAAQPVLTWLGRHFARESLLEKRILDARGQCPNG